MAEYKSSGLSVKEFCRERGVCDSSVYRRLCKEEPRLEFVEVSPVALSVAYEICIDGVTLKVPSSEPAVRIAELMRAVRC
jgi:transposase-like protein